MVIKLHAPRRTLHSAEAYKRALGVSWTHGDGLRSVHTAVNSIDDVLALVVRQEKAKAVRKRHREGAGNPPPSRATMFALAKAQAAQPARRARVKMPQFSIQQREETDT